MGYSKFIEIGVERQKDSVTVDEAIAQYTHSCVYCVKKGYNFNFDCEYTCPITIAYREKLDAIRTLRQLEHEKKVRNDELKKKLDEITSTIESIYEMMENPKELDKRNSEIDSLVNKWIQLKGGEGNVIIIKTVQK